MKPYHDDGQATFYQGDVREVLRQLPAGSVHCAITSPPYFGLRDYGTATWEPVTDDHYHTGADCICIETMSACDHKAPPSGGRTKGATLVGTGNRDGFSADGQYRDTCRKCGSRRADQQLGLEPTPEEFIATMVDVFREVKRVLRDDGTCWVNIGDSYNANTGAGFNGNKRLDEANRSTVRPNIPGIKPKDLVGIPWMLAFALRADGWYLRSDIIWAKPNPMPESVTDRPTKAHEYLFLLSKKSAYYYDAEAVREPHISDGRGGFSNKDTLKSIRFGASHAPSLVNAEVNPNGRNKRSVWTIATEAYSEAHFATFPQALVRPCILAGTSEHGVCSECGAPWVRCVEKEVQTNGAGRKHIAGGDSSIGQGWEGTPRGTVAVRTTGWRPSCPHEAPTVPATVLDPFLGSGTTALVAKSLGRRAIGIDLSAEYLEMAANRCRQMGLMI